MHASTKESTLARGQSSSRRCIRVNVSGAGRCGVNNGTSALVRRFYCHYCPTPYRYLLTGSRSSRAVIAQSIGKIDAEYDSMQDWWGKERTLDWEQDIVALSPLDAGGSAADDVNVQSEVHVHYREVHPVGQLFWRSPDALDGSVRDNAATNDALAQQAATRPSVARVNSASVTLRLPVRWPAVLRLAHQFSSRASFSDDTSDDGIDVARDGNGRRVVVRAVRCGVDTEGHDMLRVADVESLESCLAAALRGFCVDVDVVPGSSVANAGLPEAAPEERAESIEAGWSAGSRRPSQVQLLMDPGTVVCTRETELCCWPKVWRFAAMMESGGAVGDSLGTVAAEWCGRRGRWTVSNRHRAIAARLLSTPLRCTVRLPQHVTGESDRSDRIWRGPASKTRLRRAAQAAEAMAEAKREGASAAEVERAVRVCEGAVQKAPRECGDVGVDRAAIAQLRARLKDAEQWTAESAGPPCPPFVVNDGNGHFTVKVVQ